MTDIIKRDKRITTIAVVGNTKWINEKTDKYELIGYHYSLDQTQSKKLNYWEY